MLAREKSLPQKQREALTKLLENISSLKTAINALRASMERIRQESDALAKPEVVVENRAYPETVFCVKGERLRIRDEFIGPVRALVIDGKLDLHTITA